MQNRVLKICLSILAALSIAACAFLGCSENETPGTTPAPTFNNTGDPSVGLAPSPANSPGDISSTGNPGETASPLETSTPDYKASFIAVEYTGQPLEPVLITSYEQWEALTSYNTVESTDARAIQPLSDYSEATFEDAVLIVGEIVMNTGSATPKVVSIDTASDPIVVDIDLDRPEVATADMAQRRVFIVLPRTSYNDQAGVIFDYPNPGANDDTTAEG